MTSDGSVRDSVAATGASRCRVPAAGLPEDVAAMLAGREAAQLNLYRALANSPAVVRAWRDFLWTLRDECMSPRALREIAILRTAVRHSSQYEWFHHASMAVAAGVDAGVVASLGQWRNADALSDDERLVLELADAMCDGHVPQALARTALDRFGAERYVELVVTIGTYVMVPRVLDALGVPTEDGAVAPVPLPAES
jgi:4-carboxymuconolactone decarboxylase